MFVLARRSPNVVSEFLYLVSGKSYFAPNEKRQFLGYGSLVTVFRKSADAKRCALVDNISVPSFNRIGLKIKKFSLGSILEKGILPPCTSKVTVVAAGPESNVRRSYNHHKVTRNK